MATSRQPKARAFSEVVFRGSPKVVRACLSGLLLGAGRPATVFYSFLDGVHHEGKAERLAELVGVRSSDCHVIVDAETATWLRGLSRAITAETGLVITSNRRIRGASMDLRYHTYGKKYEDEILALLKNLPAGVKLSGFRQDTRVDERGRGLEVYTPVHEFEATGDGAVSGPVDELIGLRRRLAEFPLVRVSDIQLTLV
jgi:hypothetical protein